MVCKTLNELEDRWKKIGKKIEKNLFTREQAYHIAHDCLNEIISFIINNENEREENLIQAMTEIINGLNISLSIAVSNYENKHKTNLFTRFFGNRDFKIDINAVKNEIINKFR